MFCYILLTIAVPFVNSFSRLFNTASELCNKINLIKHGSSIKLVPFCQCVYAIVDIFTVNIQQRWNRVSGSRVSGSLGPGFGAGSGHGSKP